MWVEKSDLRSAEYWLCHPPCEDVSWKLIPNARNSSLVWSSSLWGWELKTSRFLSSHSTSFCHPPCEDVSWKALDTKNPTVTTVVILLVRMWVENASRNEPQRVTRQSSSLWGCELKNCEDDYEGSRQKRHPPCEDVSWKINGKGGCGKTTVILLVRMWVEKYHLSFLHCVYNGHPP